MKSNKTISQVEVAASVRKSWGLLNPMTKVLQSKKGYRRHAKFRGGKDE